MSFSTDNEGRKPFELPEKRDGNDDSSASEDDASKPAQKPVIYHRRLKRKGLSELKPGGRAWKRERRKQLAAKLSKQSSGTSEELQPLTSDLSDYQDLQPSTSGLSAEFAPSVVIQDQDSDGSSTVDDERLQDDNVFLDPEDLDNYADVSSSNSSEEEDEQIESNIPEEFRLDDEEEQEPGEQLQDGGDGEEQMNTDGESNKEQENDPVRNYM